MRLYFYVLDSFYYNLTSQVSTYLNKVTDDRIIEIVDPLPLDGLQTTRSVTFCGEGRY